MSQNYVPMTPPEKRTYNQEIPTKIYTFTEPRGNKTLRQAFSYGASQIKRTQVMVRIR